MSADLDLWHVCMKDGSVRAMNLDQIDEAFHAGLIDGKCGVVRAGELEWSTLGELAGLDDVTPSPHSVAPVAMDASGDVPAFRPKRGRAVAGAFVGIAAVVAIAFAATHAPGTFVKKSFAKLRAVKTEEPRAAAVIAAPPPPAPVPSPTVKVEPPKPEAKVEAKPNVPTFDPHDLPNAKATAKKAKRR